MARKDVHGGCGVVTVITVSLLVLMVAQRCSTVPLDSQVFTIAAFNIQTFGKAKMDDPTRADRIRQITSRYDVMLLQEIRDSSGDSVVKLLNLLNAATSNGLYAYVMSERLGRSTTYKEQYAFFYRTDRIEKVSTYQYTDVGDVFEREPYAFVMRPKSPLAKKMALVALHAKPEDAVAEIGNLTAVIKNIRGTFCDAEIVVLGDLNAGCSYANEASRLAANDTLTTDTDHYQWLIGENVDTTTGQSDCAYDRIIIESPLLVRVAAGSSKAYDFCTVMNLTTNECGDISDHYPVETQLTY